MRRAQPLLVVLLALVTSLILLTTTVIGLTAYLSIRQEITRLANTIVSNAAQQAAARSQEFLARVGPVLELNRNLVAHDPKYGVFSQGPPSDREWRARAELFLRILRANPEFTRIHYGDQERTFTAAHRDDGGSLWVDYRRVVGGRTLWRLYRVSATGDWVPVEPPTKEKWYDPTERDWYTLAVSRRRLAWASPYIFAASGRPGVTAALPLLHPDGRVAGVFGVDIELGKLSEFVRQLPVGRGGKAYLLSPDFRVLAHPDGVHLATAKENRPLPLATEHSDPILRAAARGLSVANHILEFGPASQRYLGAYHRFQVGQDRTWLVVTAIPEKNILGPARRNGLLTLGWCLGLLALSLGIGAALSARISRPLHAFARELRQVERFVIPADPSPPSSITEVEVIGQALDRMKSSLRSFEKYVPTDLVRALLQSGQEARLGGQTARLTLFFGDVVDYSAAAEQLSPAELVEALAEYLEEMEAIISRHNGIVDKYVGDAVMAFWGAPIRPLDHPEREACAAALEYINRLQRLRAQREAEDRPFFEARIGIHTGEALVGNIGSQRRMDYTAMGDAVNVASRLEELNRVYRTQILISASTYQAVCEEFEARPIDCVAVKGRSSAIQIYELLARRDELGEARRPLLDAYAEGLTLYRARQWQAAQAQFLRALEYGPDGPSQLFLARCQAYLEAPPPPDWDGVYVLTSK